METPTPKTFLAYSAMKTLSQRPPKLGKVGSYRAATAAPTPDPSSVPFGKQGVFHWEGDQSYFYLGGQKATPPESDRAASEDHKWDNAPGTSELQAERTEPTPVPIQAASEDTPKSHEPFITKGGALTIPFESDPRYHWWNGGQSLAETMAELTRAGTR